MSKLWVLIGESSRATLYSMTSRRAPLEEIECYAQPGARQHEQDLTSDVPGQGFDGKGKGQHALEPKAGKKDKEMLDFAKALTDKLENGRQQGEYNQLVLCASPHFLGLLRKNLTHASNELVIATIDKNLVKLPPEEIRRHLSEVLSQ